MGSSCAAAASQVPQYPWFDQVPAGLFTRSQLAEKGLRPGGPLRARVVWKRGQREAHLFRLDEATPKRKVSEAQRQVLDHARQLQDERRRTCPDCKEVRKDPPSITEYGLQCGFCYERDWQAERDADREGATAWAREVLALGDGAVLLDTETTGLHGAYVVEMAVLGLDGTVLLDTLVDPECDIPEDAQHIHGITDRMVAGAPMFAELVPQLEQLLHGRRVLIYNVDFDKGVLLNELTRYFGPYAPDEGWGCKIARRRAEAWLKRARGWRCAMKAYAKFYGEWSDYHRSYRWQPLPYGNHRALGDCRGTLRLLHEMAAAPVAPGGPHGR